MIGPDISKAIENTIAASVSATDVKILQARLLTGGDINEAFLVRTQVGEFFVKWNKKDKYPGIFNAEANGLRALQQVGSLQVPNVIGIGTDAKRDFLILEYIQTQRKKPNFWEAFGKGLAAIHQTSSEKYGWEEDNYIGSLRQNNTWIKDFDAFYVTNRLEPMLKLAVDKGRIPAADLSTYQLFCDKFATYVPQEVPALLHGDLWGGNYIVNAEGLPCVIDPAVSFGHRESDLAMMRLFGGFSHDVFHYYNQYFPLEKGWQERVPVFSVYPLLVHVVLFGGSYIAKLKDTVKKFI
ncbi:MAG: fructosamine kinase family protein [Schleiferiaceae bacterium]|nr:fructosamine kinase family protein [Schleiferiaceae bacterium]